MGGGQAPRTRQSPARGRASDQDTLDICSVWDRLREQNALKLLLSTYSAAHVSHMDCSGTGLPRPVWVSPFLPVSPLCTRAPHPW